MDSEAGIQKSRTQTEAAPKKNIILKTKSKTPKINEEDTSIITNDKSTKALSLEEQFEFNDDIKTICSNYRNVKYYETENNNSLDFGKWHWLLSQSDYSIYDYVVLTNDSFVIHSSINHYLNLISKYDVELYGYNDSSEKCYHFQSYLFALKNTAIPLFLENIANLPEIKTHLDLVTNAELMLTKWFPNNKCFLNIANIPSNNERNIFFHNDDLYTILKNNNLLPFSKLKRLYP